MIAFIKRVLRFVKRLAKKLIVVFFNFVNSCKQIGLKGTVRNYYFGLSYKFKEPEKPNYYDVIFINGCGYEIPQAIRYRVDHQKEQLESQGLKCLKIDFWNLKMEHVAMARTFIAYRLINNDFFEEFVKTAKSMNKKVIFDIDDLVIDTKYTENIPYLQTMSKQDRDNYDFGVKKMGEALKCCGSAMTTTEDLASELSNYVDEVFINRNVASIKMAAYSEEALESFQENDSEEVRIGYFSGSITHNDDINYIVPVLVRVLHERPNVKFVVCGEADLPDSLKDYENRVEFLPFTNWENLPKLIRSVDINIAPLVDSIFNRAKSENKWMEASLVKVPTVASNIGAFKHSIENDITGVLCDDLEDWYKGLISLIDDKNKRQKIGNNAYKLCTKKYLTISSGENLANYIKKTRSTNCVFLLHNLDNTGGCMVIKKHASILQAAGIDVSLSINQKKIPCRLLEFENSKLPVLKTFSYKNTEEKNLIPADIDKVVTTFWVTNDSLNFLPNVKEIYYLVQGYEIEFNEPGHPTRVKCAATYHRDFVNYITVSKWCQMWLKDQFNQSAVYAPNCIDSNLFKWKSRNFSDQKIRVLIEGDCIAPNKNIDEAFNITNQLDRDKFEVWYLSYGDRKKNWYKIDKFISNIPHNEVPEVYENCHILLKTSLAESFSYPPLEMMATGGYVVAIPNEGNVEYLKDNNNCLMFEQGQTDKAIELINNIANDKTIRNTLEKNSKLTVEDRKWESHTKDIVKMYSC